MSTRDTSGDTKLASLEKWRTSELDVAQVAHARKQATAAERERVVTGVQEVVIESQELARAQLAANRIISVDSLTRLRHYTTVQLSELEQAQTQLIASRRDVAKAHAVILKKFEDLTVIERLRKRRAAQADKEMLRREQRALDEQALMRASTDDDQ